MKIHLNPLKYIINQTHKIFFPFCLRSIRVIAKYCTVIIENLSLTKKVNAGFRYKSKLYILYIIFQNARNLRRSTGDSSKSTLTDSDKSDLFSRIGH